MSLREHFRDYRKQPRRKIILEWLIIIGSILIGVFLGEILSKLNIGLNIRYSIYRVLHEQDPRPLLPRHTVLVVIDDEEYWKGELARRVPIKRDYLAKLLKKLAEANPAVIALDFDLRSPVFDDNSMIEFDAYKDETNEFIDAVKEVSGWYDLRFVSANTTDDLVKKGHNLIIVARVGNNNNLHIRIFDTNGKIVFDKAENEEKLDTLKNHLNSSPFDESSLSPEKKQEIIQDVRSIAGLTLPGKIPVVLPRTIRFDEKQKNSIETKKLIF